MYELLLTRTGNPLYLLNFFTQVKRSPNISRFGLCNIFQGFTTARRDDQPPEYISASQVQQVLRYKELIPEIEKSFVNFSDRKNGGIIQPVRLKVPVKEHSG